MPKLTLNNQKRKYRTSRKNEMRCFCYAVMSVLKPVIGTIRLPHNTPIISLFAEISVLNHRIVNPDNTVLRAVDNFLSARVDGVICDGNSAFGAVHQRNRGRTGVNGVAGDVTALPPVTETAGVSVSKSWRMVLPVTETVFPP